MDLRSLRITCQECFMTHGMQTAQGRRYIQQRDAVFAWFQPPHAGNFADQSHLMICAAFFFYRFTKPHVIWAPAAVPSRFFFFFVAPQHQCTGCPSTSPGSWHSPSFSGYYCLLQSKPPFPAAATLFSSRLHRWDLNSTELQGHGGRRWSPPSDSGVAPKPKGNQRGAKFSETTYSGEGILLCGQSLKCSKCACLCIIVIIAVAFRGGAPEEGRK